MEDYKAQLASAIRTVESLVNCTRQGKEWVILESVSKQLTELEDELAKASAEQLKLIVS